MSYRRLAIRTAGIFWPEADLARGVRRQGGPAPTVVEKKRATSEIPEIVTCQNPDIA